MLLGVVGVGGAAETITVDPEPGVYEYSKPSFASNEGEVPLFSAAADQVPHNVTANRRGPDGRPLFRSRTIRTGTAAVEGTQYLEAGSYGFNCTIHLGMDATLMVGEGTPKPRPQAIVAVLRQTVSGVRESGRLKVRLRSPTGARAVTLIARGAGVLLARESGVGISRGASRIVRLGLTRRGRSALAERRSLKISLRAKVPFGSTASASRTLSGG
jgi:hypothetical protein